MNYNYDVIVIGAGSAGLTAAIGLSKGGKKVLLIEKSHMGGDCTNYGCIPSKTLIHLAHQYLIAKNLGAKDQELSKFKAQVLPKVEKKVQNIRREESPEKLEENNPKLKVVKGQASFIDKHTIKVEKQKYRAKKIIIATGSKAHQIKIPGLKKEFLLTNKNLFSLKSLPQKLLIIGGGAIACEIAEAIGLLDVSITLVIRGERLLNQTEPEISHLIEKDFQKLGIKIHYQSHVISCKENTAHIQSGKKKKKNHQEEFDYILMAIGREPELSELKLEKLKINHNKNRILVDKHYRTNHKNIFAIGDIASTTRFTHSADDQGRHLVKKILFPLAFAPENVIPAVTFLRKEIAQVGLTFAEASNKYHHQSLLKISLPLEATDRAKTDELTNGLLILTVKKISGKILGAQLYSRNAGEMINVITNAIQHKLSLWKIAKTVYPYPTLSRIFKKAGDQLLNETITHLKKDLWFLFKKNLPKILTLIFWASIIYAFFSYKINSGLSNLEIIENIFQYEESSFWGPIIYLALYTFRPLIFFPATPLTLLAGAIFGLWQGLLFTIIGANLSANFAYLLAKILGKDLIPSDEMGLLSKWKTRLQENTFISVVTLRLLYTPFDIVNYLSGFLNLKWSQFALGTLIGILPGSLFFIGIGSSVNNLSNFNTEKVTVSPLQLTISLIFFALSILYARHLRKKKSSRSKHWQIARNKNRQSTK